MTRYRSRSASFLVLLSCLLAAAGPCVAGPKLAPDPVEAQLLAERGELRAGEKVRVMIRLRMDEGWYVYGPETGGSGLPTTVLWILPEGLRAGPLQWPAAQNIEVQGVVAHGYRGDLRLLAEISADPGIRKGAAVVLRAEVGWLACRNECVPGSATLTVELAVPADGAPEAPSDSATEALFRGARSPSGAASGSAPAAPSVGILLALVLALAGGILLNLMPCVFPVLSLKIMALVRQAGAGRGEALRHALWYAAGVLVSFWAIAGVLAALRAGGTLLGLGFQFQEPAMAAAAAVVFFLLGLNLFGVFEVGSGLGGLGAAARSWGGRLGSFASGLFTTVVATPCSAPFLGTALGYAVAQPPAVSLAVFTALGLGLALPFVLLSAWPGLAARMPKPGRWMETLRNLLGFPLMATVVWMAWLVSVQAGTGTVVNLLWALLAAGAGAWVWGRWGRLDGSRRARTAAASAAILLAMGGLALAVATASTAASAAKAHGVVVDPMQDGWEPWSPEGQAEALAEGRTVFVDFTARWCLTCQLNETTTLSDRRVRDGFRGSGAVLMKADWTDRDDAIASALSGLGRAGVPLYALYVKGSDRPVLLPELLTPGVLLDALRKAR